MILYVNGDSHSCGHDAGGPEYSYGRHVADALGWKFVCDAEPAVSNDRIIRRTRTYLKDNKPDFVIIGWSTWEREEWFHNGQSYHVTASGADDVPEELKIKYKEWVIRQAAEENYTKLEYLNYDKIWAFHLELESQKVKHLFFNTYSCFLHKRGWNVDSIETKNEWFKFSIDPYRQEMTYYFWLKNNGFSLVDPKWYHYDADAHQGWANFILPKIKEILTTNE